MKSYGEVPIPDTFTCICGVTLRIEELMKMSDDEMNKVIALHVKHIKNQK
jgi:hypothetical protein